MENRSTSSEGFLTGEIISLESAFRLKEKNNFDAYSAMKKIQVPFGEF